jgi:8-oxo-dGTP diphosphatase
VRRPLLVVAGLIERRGRVLLSQRRSDQSFPSTWEFPGGKVELGEAPKDALVREIHEELGCTVKVREVVEVVFHAYPDFDLVMPIYRATVTGRAPQAVTVEAVAWVPLRQLLQLPMPPADVPFAKRLARIPAPRRARGTGARSCRRSSKPARRS